MYKIQEILYFFFINPNIIAAINANGYNTKIVTMSSKFCKAGSISIKNLMQKSYNIGKTNKIAKVLFINNLKEAGLFVEKSVILL